MSTLPPFEEHDHGNCVICDSQKRRIATLRAMIAEMRTFVVHKDDCFKDETSKCNCGLDALQRYVKWRTGC